MKAFCTCSGMSASGTHTRRWFSSNTSANRSPLRSSTTLAPRKLHALDLGVIGQPGGGLVVELDDVAEVHDRHRHVLVLAELPVGGLQIGKIDPSEHLVLARERLRVVQGGRNQLLEVDVLDVEGFAHMRAAGVQQLRDLLLVSHGIELRLHRVRRGGYLTKCKSRGEDFDEDGFHRGSLEISLSVAFSASLTA